MSYPYDPQFAPPFPALPIVLRSIEEGESTDVYTAHIDTGADSTLVPSALIDAIGADEYATARLRSHWGEHREVSLYLVDMEVAGELLPSVEVIADDRSSDILLGRNVLNRLILLLDGYNHQTDLLTRRPERF